MIRINLSLILLLLLTSCTDLDFGAPTVQITIPRIESMPSMPQPYKILDWKQRAIDFDRYVFDFNREDSVGPLIWLDDSRRNVSQTTFGLYTAVNDCRQGPDKNNGEFHESLTSLSAIMGAALVGIDKRNQGGLNYVKMVQNYFNSDTGWNIMMNNTSPSIALLGGGYGRDWWYDVLPNVLYYAVCDLLPGVENSDTIQHTIAEQFLRADSVLDGNYDYSYFDYGAMHGVVNNIVCQQDAAGGHGYVLYSAYQKFHDVRYLEAAKSSIDVLNAQSNSRFYEILLPMGIYTAARLNAEQGTNYDLTKMINWVFDGCTSVDGRNGWGVIVGHWGDYDVSGLQGSIIDGGGYAFLMNSMKMAWPLVPMVKYQPQYARAIGRWMVNNVNAARLFFADEISDNNQWLPQFKTTVGRYVAYEGLRYSDCYDKPLLTGVHPVALGDGPRWTDNMPEDNPPQSMFSLYSTSPIGIFGGMVRQTNVEGILRLDCNATDFYAHKPYPVYLYYNPHDRPKTVAYSSHGKFDLFDIVSKKYVARAACDSVDIVLDPDSAYVIIEIPTTHKIVNHNDTLYVGDNIIRW